MAASTDSRTIAVAGYRGLALFNVATNRWRLFGNLQHERDFVVNGGLVWCDDVLAVACMDLTKNRHEVSVASRGGARQRARGRADIAAPWAYGRRSGRVQLRCYDRHDNLDASSVLAREPMPAGVLAMAALPRTGEHGAPRLLVLLETLAVCVYRVPLAKPAGRTAAGRFELLLEASLAGLQPPLRNVRAILLAPTTPLCPGMQLRKKRSMNAHGHAYSV